MDKRTVILLGLGAGALGVTAAGRARGRRIHPTRTVDGRAVTVSAGVTVDRTAAEVEAAWREVARTDLGAVTFTEAPGGRGTEVRVKVTAAPRGGPALARLRGTDPRQQVTDELRRFKQVLETGAVVRSEAAPDGPRATALLHQRPGQPAGRPEGSRA
jgi:uncharacterized membrane protein